MDRGDGVRRGIDKLGVIVAAMIVYGGFFAPFVSFRANRIVPGEARSLFEALPMSAALFLSALLVLSVVFVVLRTPTGLRLGLAAIVLAALTLIVGHAGTALTPPGNSYARVAPASGFWILLFAFGLLAADAIARLKPSPLLRVGLLGLALSGLVLLLASGAWDGLSLLKEYAGRADVFWQEAGKHVSLALGSLVSSVVVGLPLGILCHRVKALRDAVLNALNLIQTIPSIALFGILIGPLGWIAATVPGAAALGIRGIGMAPAFVALFLYSLLPVVANTVIGLAGVPREANEAARGVGMTDRQRLLRIEFPLALPVILTGIRIVLVQNIGLATIAALIGGGGFGVFVFQGIGQTAMDLVLLGAVPTVLLAFAAAILLDALIEANAPARKGKSPA
ncbi:ABC transporter permease [Rhizobium sp. CC-YZS058]|uniref:ABC transporter permease n=1 Tax=Rhizobium sp. CC-YZS058 TaxID=3042153 RepID=UPI002B05D142|nr:ABC transporter permease [Rhizobium sp. CC-YZS058]MEA3536965.1 ABC transporter permease [Rhizobium sp. CC-YZS058]